MPMTVPRDSATLPAVAAVSVVILSQTFNPEKFEALLTLLAGQYVKTGDPIRILGSYLSVFTTKQVKVDDESWSASAYNDKQALLAGCSLTSFISLFGVHSVLVYNAMVLKKRVVVVVSQAAPLPPPTTTATNNPDPGSKPKLDPGPDPGPGPDPDPDPDANPRPIRWRRCSRWCACCRSLCGAARTGKFCGRS